MAIKFTSSLSQHIILGTNSLPSIQGPLSISLWFKYSNIPTSGNQSYYASWSGTKLIAIGHRGGNIGAWKNGGTFLVNTAAPAANILHNIVYTLSSNSNKLYLNGSLVASSLIQTNSGSTANSRLGAYQSTEYFDGTIEDVRIYNIVLNLYEVSSIYGSFGSDGIIQGLVSRYLFNEDSDIPTSILDSVGNNHGSSTSFPTYVGRELKTKRKFM
jgi:hypothetical protein